MGGPLYHGGMCLIAFHWQTDGTLPLLVAANRDEFYARPTAPMAWWDGGRILAGRDLEAGGTWLGLTPAGRFAALTNHRDPKALRAGTPSRGQLPVRFLEGRGSAASFLDELRTEAPAFNPFSLLLYDGRDLLGYESRLDRRIAFTPGIHAVSNGAFDEPWPKVEALKAGMAAGGLDDEGLLGLLAEPRAYGDDLLPQTGVSLDWERALSPAFIRTPTYGTRASTLVRLGLETVMVLEQRFTRDGPQGRSEFRFERAG
ncbi:NRDE family protein [Geothrix sp. PMB-07]|uniref:NRDE family protein n=1 Tax=Geothrix sp. PMB-07 TaxID=3068640 RepID=UPI00274220FB|nr:NRDE family protein [Geothrix sp. PMB-07]WLT32404.1 NRDE family protein [Geothrix sp. PMB-07]